MKAEFRSVLKLPRNRELVIGERTLIMGILNTTPDSFSDGGRFFSLNDALARAHQMVKEGADIIDIGGFSTRPGAQEVSAEEEIARVLPVIKEMRKEYNGPISIDTFRSEVAEAAIKAGSDIVNDVSGLKYDPRLARVVAEAGCPVIVMHNKLDKEYRDIMAEVIGELEESVHIARENGIADSQIVIDPGIGFGKTPEQNLIVIKNLAELLALGKPVLLGVSRKSFIGKITDLPPGERLEGSLASAVMGVMNGVSILRVHDVKETKRAVAVVDAIMRA